MLNIQSPASARNLQNLFNSKKGADVDFVLQSKLNGAEMIVSAHKAILAESSPVFDRMFYGDLPEGREVRVTDVSFEGFCEFLRLFYVSDVTLSEENLFDILKLVDKYNVEEFGWVCASLLEETVTSATVCLYYEFALTFNYLRELIDAIETTISKDPVEVLQTRSFRKSSRFVLKKILEINSMDCLESDLFKAAICWATETCRGNNMPATSENLKAALGAECLSLIRFPAMTPDELTSCVTLYPNILEKHIYDDVMDYILDDVPLTCAAHFNANTRQKSKYLVLLLRERHLRFVGYRKDTQISHILFSTSEDVWLNYMDIIIRTDVPIQNVKIDFNGVITPVELQDLTLCPQYTHFSEGYHLALSKPVLCTANRFHIIRLELDLPNAIFPFFNQEEVISFDNFVINIKNNVSDMQNYCIEKLCFTKKI